MSNQKINNDADNWDNDHGIRDLAHETRFLTDLFS